MSKPSLLITGVAGFIGFHVAKRLLDAGWNVIGVDNINPYYDPNLKRNRLAHLNSHSRASQAFQFFEEDLCSKAFWNELRKRNQTVVAAIHLAAQAGVRYSTTHPFAYISSNIDGFLNVLEFCRNAGNPPLIYASSSSVYGLNKRAPFCETDPVDHPTSLYAATKRANELMAHSYSFQYGLPTVGLRFFTVYGPWGRPDMAIFNFAEAILNKQEICVFNEGNLRRDFTYIDDVVQGILDILTNISQILNHKPLSTSLNCDSPNISTAPFRLLNIGNSQPVSVIQLVKELERQLGEKAIIRYADAPKADVDLTFASTSDIFSLTGFQPSTILADGLKKFLDWFIDYRAGFKAESFS